jgi:GNAT superfamily N-acetyltransferase
MRDDNVATDQSLPPDASHREVVPHADGGMRTTHATIPTIDPAQDLGPAIDALSAAFHDDPVFEWIYPDDAWRGHAVPRLFGQLTAAFSTRGESRVTEAADGAALWLPPGEELVAEAELEAFFGKAVDDAGPAADRLMTCFEILEEHHPTEPHWYLGFLGVIPARQGQGVGASLLRATLEGCDAAGEPAYLEATSAHNRRLYERHGFEVVRELPMPGGPSLYAMWRNPQDLFTDVVRGGAASGACRSAGGAARRRTGSSEGT